MRVIQTNLSLNWTNEIMEHQSRIFEIDEWESFIEKIKSNKEIEVKKSSMPGHIRSKTAEILEIDYDNHHMIILFDNRIKSLFYAVDVVAR